METLFAPQPHLDLLDFSLEKIAFPSVLHLVLAILDNAVEWNVPISAMQVNSRAHVEVEVVVLEMGQLKWESASVIQVTLILPLHSLVFTVSLGFYLEYCSKSVNQPLFFFLYSTSYVCWT